VIARPSILKYIAIPALVGLVATWAVYGALSRPAPKAPPTAMAVVAAQGVPAKMSLTAGDLRLAPVPLSVAAGALTATSAAAGHITLVPLAPGQIVYPDDLAQPGNSAALSYHVPAGMRAESVRVNDVTGVSGMIQPGDHVDVVAVLPKTVAGTSQARLLLQHVLVLAIGSSQQAAPTRGTASVQSYTDVTLALYPGDAVLLIYAGSQGTLQLLLDPATPGQPAPPIVVSNSAFGA
jgi:pilus assembly protein CpaB